jgi:hypothetical protein
VDLKFEANRLLDSICLLKGIFKEPIAWDDDAERGGDEQVRVFYGINCVVDALDRLDEEPNCVRDEVERVRDGKDCVRDETKCVRNGTKRVHDEASCVVDEEDCVV